MDVDALNKLKRKVSEEFNTLLCRVKKGYRPDYEFILEEISFIELINNFIEFKQKSKKPFEEENQIKLLIDRLNSIETKQGKLDCLQYTLMNRYSDIYPERYRDIFTKTDEDKKNLLKEFKDW